MYTKDSRVFDTSLGEIYFEILEDNFWLTVVAMPVDGLLAADRWIHGRFAESLSKGVLCGLIGWLKHWIKSPVEAYEEAMRLLPQYKKVIDDLMTEEAREIAGANLHPAPKARSGRLPSAHRRR